MTGALRVTVALVSALCCAVTSPARALAQDAVAAAEPDVRISAQSAPDELPDDADLGPPLDAQPRRLTPEERIRERRRNYDPSEPEHPVALQVHLGLGGALDSSLDQSLAARRYGSSPLIFQGDVALLARVTEWLYVGGRIGGRGRGWLSNDVAPASAGGVDGLAIAHARFYLGRIVDLGAILGAGIGWGGISLGRGGAADVAPRLHGSALIAFRLDAGVRLCARFAWDWFSLYDMDRYGSDLELGGPSLSLGLEIRR